MSEQVVEPDAAATVEPVDEPLGEPGLKALKAERERAAAAEKALADRDAKLKEYEDRDKSEEQKAQEERERLAREIADLTIAKTRAEIAASTAVPSDFLGGPKSGSSEDIQSFAEALIAWRGDVPTPRGPVIPGQGNQPELAPEGEAAAFARALGI